uniref:Uncharacterized protein n=1 Tax=Anguilla anguilla TaxID=7936 RepID=A0A0E9RX90_ANGAN
MHTFPFSQQSNSLGMSQNVKITS